jgi:hypothetical protein
MDGLIALAAAKKAVEDKTAGYKTKFRWCPDIGMNMGAELTGIPSDALLTAGDKYFFIKGGNINLGEQTVKTITAAELSAISNLMSTAFETPITVISGTYITDADNFLNIYDNIYSGGTGGENKSVLLTVVLDSGNALLFADSSETNTGGEPEDIQLKQPTTGTAAPTDGYPVLLWSGSVRTDGSIEPSGFDWSDFSVFLIKLCAATEQDDSYSTSEYLLGSLYTGDAYPRLILSSHDYTLELHYKYFGSLNVTRSSAIGPLTYYIKELWGVI